MGALARQSTGRLIGGVPSLPPRRAGLLLLLPLRGPWHVLLLCLMLCHWVSLQIGFELDAVVFSAATSMRSAVAACKSGLLAAAGARAGQDARRIMWRVGVLVGTVALAGARICWE